MNILIHILYAYSFLNILPSKTSQKVFFLTGSLLNNYIWHAISQGVLIGYILPSLRWKRELR